jgi:hypothetical protein
MEGKKEATPSFKKLERNQTSESEYLSFLFAFFYCKSVGICILELMHLIFPK